MRFRTLKLHFICSAFVLALAVYYICFRTTPPHIAQPQAKEFYLGMRRVFENFHGGMPDAPWNYATLPFHRGVLRPTPCALLPDIFYVASTLSAFPKIQGMLKDASFLCPQLLNASPENIALILPESETVTAQGLIAKAR